MKRYHRIRNQFLKIVSFLLAILCLFFIINKKSYATDEEASNNDVTKVLIIGNSYTQYNDFGGMIAEMAKTKKRKMVVVMANCASKDATYLVSENLAGYYWDNRQNPTYVDSENNKKYVTTLSEVAKKDWGNLNRPNQWDYVILQNHQKDGKADGNNLIYDKVKTMLASSGRFIILRTYTQSWDSHKGNAMIDNAIENGFSLVNIKPIVEQYSNNWVEYITLQDGPLHPSGKGAYLIAAACYARLFGREDLADSTDSTNFIELYNQNTSSARTKDFYSFVNYSAGDHDTEAVMRVNEEKAKKIQYLVYKNYNECIVNYYKQIGDIDKNEKIDSTDVLMLLRHIYKEKNKNTNKHIEWILNEEQIELADLDKNEIINLSDVIKLLRYIYAKNNDEVLKKHPNWINI